MRDEDVERRAAGAFLSATRQDRLHALWHALAMTGMRRGEALGLLWEDVDLENARLSVRRALIPCGREVVVSGPKTARGRRSIALDPETVEVLKGQATRQLAEQRGWDEAWTDAGLVFTKENGQALHPEDVTRYFRQAVKRTILPTIRLHDLRHTHATCATGRPRVPSRRSRQTDPEPALPRGRRPTPGRRPAAAAPMTTVDNLDSHW